MSVRQNQIEEELARILEHLGLANQRPLLTILSSLICHRLEIGYIFPRSVGAVLIQDGNYILGIIREMVRFLNSLNREQLEAVCAMTNPPPNQNYVVLIEGPPGTGKTMTIAIGASLFALNNPSNKVIIVANTHYACDRTLEFFRRLGFDHNFVKRIIPYIFDDYVNRYGIDPQSRSYYVEWPRYISISGQVRDILRRVVKVYIITLDSIDRLQYLGLRGSVMLIVDEISQIDESKFLVLLAALHQVPLSHIVLVGDPEQLYNISSQPQLRTTIARLLKLGSRGMVLAPQQPVHVYSLRIQYRMDEEICNLVNIIRERFLHSYPISTDPSVINNQIPRNIIRSRPRDLGFEVLDPIVDPSKTLVIVDTSSLFDAQKQVEDISENYPEYSNHYEASLVTGLINIISECLNVQWLINEFRILAPYRNQVSLIQRYVQERGTPALRDVASRIVSTIDSMQGKECGIIMISLTRQNPRGFIGFVREIERMYVAVSRAKMKLILVGHLDTFYISEYVWWRQLVDYLRQRPSQSDKCALIALNNDEYRRLLSRYDIPMPPDNV